MAKTASKISEKQKAIDEAWRLWHRASDVLEELNDHLQEMDDEHDISETKAGRIGYGCHSTMSEAFSTGSRILPPHSHDGGKA